MVEQQRASPVAGITRTRATLVAIGLTAAAFVAAIMGGVAFVIPIILLDFDVQSTPVFIALTIAGQLGFLAVGLGYARYRGLVVPIETPTIRELGIAVGGALLALVVAILIGIVLQLLGLVPGSVIGDAAALDPTILLGIGLLSIFVVAPIEEFLFRGVVQGLLRQVYGPVSAIAGASLLFGSIHLTNYTGSLDAVVAGALLIAGTGAVLGILYEVSGNLSVPIVAHALYNVVLSVIAYIAAV